MIDLLFIILIAVVISFVLSMTFNLDAALQTDETTPSPAEICTNVATLINDMQEVKEKDRHQIRPLLDETISDPIYRLYLNEVLEKIKAGEPVNFSCPVRL